MPHWRAGRLTRGSLGRSLLPAMPALTKPKPKSASLSKSRPAVDATGAAALLVKQAILRHLKITPGADPGTATVRDWWISTAMAVRDHILSRFLATQAVLQSNNVRGSITSSLDYLMGRLWSPISIAPACRKPSWRRCAISAWISRRCATLREDMALGNGGLGRLARASWIRLPRTNYPAIGYGIHYDTACSNKSSSMASSGAPGQTGSSSAIPWEIVRAEYTQRVQLYARWSRSPTGRAKRGRAGPARRPCSGALRHPIAGTAPRP